MLWLAVVCSGSSAVTLVVPSGCTSVQPASYTCGGLKKLKAQISLDQFSFCDKARVTCRSIGAFVDCYIFSNQTLADYYERGAIYGPDKGSYITGCSNAQICDMPFTPSEVRKATDTIHLVTYGPNVGNIGVNISAGDYPTWKNPPFELLTLHVKCQIE